MLHNFWLGGSPVGWICGYKTTDTEELWIHRANYKFPVSFWLCWASVSPTPALFKDQLYVNLRDLFLSWQNLVIDWDRWGVRSLMRCVFLIRPYTLRKLHSFVLVERTYSWLRPFIFLWLHWQGQDIAVKRPSQNNSTVRFTRPAHTDSAF